MSQYSFTCFDTKAVKNQHYLLIELTVPTAVVVLVELELVEVLAVVSGVVLEVYLLIQTEEKD